MASFPALFGGAVAMFPVTRSVRIPVVIHQFSDFTEHRWKQSAETARFVLTLDGITQAAKESIVAFYVVTKGSLDATWDITLAGVLYEYMAFESDELTCTQSQDGLWSLSIPVVQTRKN